VAFALDCCCFLAAMAVRCPFPPAKQLPEPRGKRRVSRTGQGTALVDAAADETLKPSGEPGRTAATPSRPSRLLFHPIGAVSCCLRAAAVSGTGFPRLLPMALSPKAHTEILRAGTTTSTTTTPFSSDPERPPTPDNVRRSSHVPPEPESPPRPSPRSPAAPMLPPSISGVCPLSLVAASWHLRFQLVFRREFCGAGSSAVVRDLFGVVGDWPVALASRQSWASRDLGWLLEDYSPWPLLAILVGNTRRQKRSAAVC
jgi:hypothetical protein